MIFLNTDLVLASPDRDALVALVGAFEAHAIPALHDIHAHVDGTWLVAVDPLAFEDGDSHPDSTIDALLTVVETLAPSLRAHWERCTTREFDMGFEATAARGNAPVSHAIVQRVAAVGASLRVTIYPTDGSVSTGPTAP